MPPVNNFFHSMFSCTDLYWNNKLVTSNMDTYPSRAYLENLFSFGSDVKQNQLKAGEFWYQDATGKFVDWNADEIQARVATVTESKYLELIGRLHLDLAMQEKKKELKSDSNLIELLLSSVSSIVKVLAIDVARSEQYNFSQ